ncbi:MAG: hypothetical protein N2738_05375 [Thermodesulfovibrionales bacterium]|nr:hypothetical protein [Thermodesulfovibrionales bacterium]
MSSQMLGKNISEVDTKNISNNGVWLLGGDKKLFMSCEIFYCLKIHQVGLSLFNNPTQQ